MVKVFRKDNLPKRTNVATQLTTSAFNVRSSIPPMLTTIFSFSVMRSSRPFAASTERKPHKNTRFLQVYLPKTAHTLCNWERIRSVLIASHNGAAYMKNHKGRESESMVRVILVRLHFLLMLTRKMEITCK